MRSIRNSLPTEKEQAENSSNECHPEEYQESSTIDSFAIWDVGENFSLRQSQPVQTGDSTAPHRNLESINLIIFLLSSSSLQKTSKVHLSLGQKEVFSPLCL